MSHTSVKPVWTRTYSSDLGVDIARIVGYRLHDDQGRKGPVRATVREARRDGEEALAARA